MQETINNVSLKDAALHYASHGWPVFRLAGKYPYKETHGHKDATVDREQIARWWTQRPNANIGIPTGELSGLIVLDIDMPDGHYSLKKLVTDFAALPETRRVRTANGGMHYYFLHPQDGHQYHGTLGLHNLVGLDARADGNYVVAPPSLLLGRKRYLWGNPQTPLSSIPDWLLSLLPRADTTHHQYPPAWRFAYPTGEKWLTQALGQAKEGNRNEVGFWLACQLRDDRLSLEHVKDIMLLYANRVPPGESSYTSQEAMRSVRSAFQRPPRERAKSKR